MPRLTRFLQLQRAEQWILIQCVLLLPLVAGLLRTIGLARCWALLQRAGPHPLTPSPHPLTPSPRCGEGEPQLRGGQGVRKLAGTVRMVEVAARHLPWRPTCLPRSLVLWFLLRRQGVAAELRIGVQKRRQHLEAHAWVEVDHRVVNDAPDIAAEYQPFESIAAALRVTP